MNLGGFTNLTARDAMKLFSAVFIFTLLEDIFVRLIFLPHLAPAMHAGMGFLKGDSIGYHEFAVELAKRINAEGWGAWQLRPGSDIFTLATPSGIASAIYAVWGANPLFLLPLNAAVHAASAVLLCVMLQAVFQNKLVSAFAVLPFILFPTAVSWHSQLLKDGIFILGIYIYLASWVMLTTATAPLNRRLPLLLMLASAGLLIVWAVRTYMLVVLASATVMLCVFLMIWSAMQGIPGQRNWRRIGSIAIFSVCLLGITLAINKTDSRPGMGEWTGNEVKNSVYSGGPSGAPASAENTGAKAGVYSRTCAGWTDSSFVPLALSRLASKLVIVRNGYYDDVYSAAGSTIDREVCITSFYGLVGFLPRALAVGLLAPFPNQWIDFASHGGGASRVIAGFEMVLTYLALISLLLFGRRYWRRPEFWLLLGFGLSVILLYAVVTPNIGALHRMRYGFLMLLVGMGFGAVLMRFRFRPLSS